MCKALLELMKPEIDAAIEAAVGPAVEKTALEIKFDDVESVMKEYNASLENACKTMKMALEDYWKVKEKRKLANG